MKKSYLFVLISLLAVSLILVGCATKTSGKKSKAIFGKAISGFDWESCFSENNLNCQENFANCVDTVKKCNQFTAGSDEHRLCNDGCLEKALGYKNVLVSCTGGSVLGFSGKHNQALIGQFQLTCNDKTNSNTAGSKGTVAFQKGCRKSLTGLSGNYNDKNQMHQIKGYCEGEKVPDVVGPDGLPGSFNCPGGIQGAEIKVDPQGFINDINKVYCVGDTLPAKTAAPAKVPAKKSTTKTTSACGNNKIEGQEVCDGTDLAGDSLCTDHSSEYASGNVKCKADCSAFDFSGCVKKTTAVTKKPTKSKSKLPEQKFADSNITIAYKGYNETHLKVGWYNLSVTEMDATRAKIKYLGGNLSSVAEESTWITKGANYTFRFDQGYMDSPRLEVNVTEIVYQQSYPDVKEVTLVLTES